MTINVESDKIILTKSPFSIYEDEEIKFDGRTQILNLDMVMLKVKRGQIKPIDYEILRAVSELRYATSRQITLYIEYNKRDIKVNQCEIQTRLNFLNSSSILSRYKYVNKEKETNLRIYCLERHAKTLLVSRLYECAWKPTDSAQPDMIKKYLARNQLYLELYSSCSNINNIETNKRIGDFVCDLFFELDNEERYYVEVVRKNQNLEHIKKVLKIYSDKFATIPVNKPNLIILCEEDIHAFEIFKVIISNKIVIDGYFSTDLRVLQREINKIFISFDIIDKKVKLQEVLKETIKINENTGKLSID